MPSLSQGLPSSVESTSRIWRRTSSRPPTSSQVTFGISTRTSRMPLGSTSDRADSKSAMDTRMDSSMSVGT